MKHLGDITQIDGSVIPVVDVITGGSPCQDLSIAGKREGLAGERSGLFMEQIRIIKEMREASKRSGRTGEFVQCRYAVWENVVGAMSSKKGKDFQAVLTEFVRVSQQDAPDVPMPEKGKWPKAGCLYSDLGSWSIAWRVHDAQFWGVPQRRKRIALVADFGGLSAPEILFERKGVPWNPQEGGAQREEVAGGTGDSVESASGFTNRGIASGNITETLRANSNGALPMEVKRESHEPIPINTMIATRHNALGRGTGFGVGEEGEPQFTLSSNHCHAVCAGFSFGQSEKARSIGYQEEVSPTLRGGEGGNQKPCIVYDARGNGDGQTVPTITGDHESGGCSEHVLQYRTVRRLTPLECERLQGYPDGWTDIGEWTDSKGKKHRAADAPRYKALGNSIALPYWKVLLKRISAQYDRDATLGSLFDGIGGFPYLWEQINGKGSALWASEIEEFPIAVTKKRFPESTT